MLRTLMPPMAAYEPLVTGEKSMRELEADGVDIDLVKKLRSGGIWARAGK